MQRGQLASQSRGNQRVSEPQASYSLAPPFPQFYDVTSCIDHIQQLVSLLIEVVKKKDNQIAELPATEQLRLRDSGPRKGQAVMPRLRLRSWRTDLIPTIKQYLLLPNRRNQIGDGSTELPVVDQQAPSSSSSCSLALTFYFAAGRPVASPSI